MKFNYSFFRFNFNPLVTIKPKTDWDVYVIFFANI